jgi:LacI family transcriptional regulator
MQAGYSPRFRRVKKGSRATLGVLVGARSLEAARGEQNIMRYLEGLCAAAEESDVLLHFHASSPQQEAASTTEHTPVMVREDACGGVIFLGPHDPAYVHRLADHVPVITLSWLYEGTEHDAVVIANADSVAKLVGRLVDLGHRQLAWVDDHYSASFFDERKTGFVQACLSHGLRTEDQILFGHELFDGFVPRSADLFGAFQGGASAFVCACDPLALRVIEGLEDHGLCVPQQVSVTGFDATGLLTRSGLGLTGVDPNFVEMGRAAVMLAMGRLTDPMAAPRTLTVKARLVPGQTIGRNGTDESG